MATSSVIQEDPKPARRLVAVPCIIGFAAVLGVLLVDGFNKGLDWEISALEWLAAMIPTFALLAVLILKRLSPQGTWMQTDHGLRFCSKSGDVDWDIHWASIVKMTNTSVSLVLWWENKPGRPRRAMLLLAKPQASDLISEWRRQKDTK